jgi:hypothetical protein
MNLNNNCSDGFVEKLPRAGKWLRSAKNAGSCQRVNSGVSPKRRLFAGINGDDETAAADIKTWKKYG